MAADEIEEKTLIELSKIQREAIQRQIQYWRKVK